MIKKISKFLKKIPAASFSFSLPIKKNLLIFDDESFIDFRYILENREYFLLKTRFQNEKNFILHPLIIIKTLINYRGNLWSAYLISIIQTVSPQVIITLSDNSLKFSEIANRMKQKKINFYAIQNGARYDLKRFKHRFNNNLDKVDNTKKFFIPNFLCFGQFEIDDYKKYKINVEKFYPIGSLRLSNYLEENKISVGFNKKKNEYDILLISDGITCDVDKNFGFNNTPALMAEYIKFLIKYVKNRNKKFICSFKRLNSSQKDFEEEIKFYKKYLNDEEYEFLINNSTLNHKKKRYLTYELMLKSDLSVSAFSTLLRENLSLGRKTLSINFINSDVFEFPINGICKLKRCSYNEFENKLDQSCDMDREKFIEKLSGRDKYLMEFDKNYSTINKIKNIIDNTLNR